MALRGDTPGPPRALSSRLHNSPSVCGCVVGSSAMVADAAAMHRAGSGTAGGCRSYQY
jgi:hypothetical protein